MNTVENEVNDTLGYLIDKFNISLDITASQIAAFSKEMATKIIAWKLSVSTIIVLICSIILVAAIIYCKNEKIIKTFKDLKANQMPEKDFGIYSLKCVICFFTICITTILVLSNIYNIIMCLVFPEKIILEFVSYYL